MQKPRQKNMKKTLNIIKLHLNADRNKILAGFLLFSTVFSLTYSFLPKASSADYNQYLSISTTARNITRGDSSWQKTINANPGDKIAFSIQINSNDNNNLNNVIVSDSLPYQFSYVSGSVNLSGNYISGDITAGGVNIGSLYKNQSKTITFEACLSSTQSYYTNTTTLTNNAYAKADNVSQISDSAQVYVGNNNNYNNPSSGSMGILETARNITKGDSSWQKTINANPGDKIAFTIKIYSNNNSTVYNASVSDTLPYQLSYVSGSTAIDGARVADGIAGGGIFAGSLSGGQTKSITFEAYVSSGNNFYNSSSALTNYAYAKADNASQISDSAQVQINSNGNYYPDNYNYSDGYSNNIPQTGMAFTKTVQNITNPNGNGTSNYAYPGETLKYTLTYTNNGNFNFYNTRISDSLPANVTFLSSDSVGNYNSSTNTITWNIGSLYQNNSRRGSVSYLVRVASAPAQTIVSNAATICADNIPNIQSNTVQTIIYSPGAAPSQPNYQQPTQVQPVNQPIPVRAVTGANSIFPAAASSVGLAALAVLVFYFLTQNSNWFAKKKLVGYSLVVRLKN
jgi:uncharacterized repeat protein (TIGR01451 family)